MYQGHAYAQRAYEVLQISDDHLAPRSFLVGDSYSIADIGVVAYAHTAEEAGIDTASYPRFRTWCDRITEQEGFIDDLPPYPPNASIEDGRSIYG